MFNINKEGIGVLVALGAVLGSVKYSEDKGKPRQPKQKQVGTQILVDGQWIPVQQIGSI
jgi:hypothetical protein